MLANAINSPINVTSNNQPTTAKLHFCGYSVLKNDLMARNIKTDKIIDSIIKNTSTEEQKNLLQMHCYKVKIVNRTDHTLQEELKSVYNLSKGSNLGLCIDEKKLQLAWEHIDSITYLSPPPSWNTAILLGSVAAISASLYNNTEVSYSSRILHDIIVSGVYTVFIKIVYKIVRDIAGSKPRMYYLTRKKQCLERIFNDYVMKQNLKDPSVSQINTSLFDTSDFPIIFENLYWLLGISGDQTLAFFNATLIGIVDTWIELNYRQLFTDDKNIKIEKDAVNKKIIENTLLALELNRLIYQDKQNITAEEKDIIIAAIIVKYNIGMKNRYLENMDNTFIRPSKVENILKNDLNNLKPGFYTMNIDTFLALSVTESFASKVYCLFMPLLNKSYQTSSVDDIYDLISSISHFKLISADKIGGDIEQVYTPGNWEC
jgi:hypothetical protein